MNNQRVKGVRPKPLTCGKGGELKRITNMLRVFDPGRLLVVRVGRLRGRVGGGGCIVVAEFGMERLHLIHADIVGRLQFKFMHRGRWVEVDVVGEGAGL